MTDIAPMVLSAVVCDKVLFDAPTKTSSLISIRDAVLAPRYPIRYPQLFFFAELTNGHKSASISARLIDTNENDRVMVERKVDVRFPDVKAIVSVVLGFDGLVFNHPGEYCFQLFCGEQMITSRRLICAMLKKPPANGPKPEQNPNT